MGGHLALKHQNNFFNVCDTKHLNTNLFFNVDMSFTWCRWRCWKLLQRCSLTQYVLFWTLKLDEEKSKCAGLAQENSFGLDEEKSKCAGLTQENSFGSAQSQSLLAVAGERRY